MSLGWGMLFGNFLIVYSLLFWIVICYLYIIIARVNKTIQRKKLKEKINAAENESNYEEKEQLEKKLDIFDKFGTLTKHE